MFFWSSLAFLMIQWMLAFWSLVPLPFLNPAWTSGSSQFMPSLENFQHYFVGMWNASNCVVVWTFFPLHFFVIGMKTDLFQSCGHCWVFQICWYIECSTFTGSSVRIWKSSTGIPSPPLPLFIVTLPKAHLTSHSRMSGSRWVITPSWLSGSWRSFLYNSSVYSYHLLVSLAFPKFWSQSHQLSLITLINLKSIFFSLSSTQFFCLQKHIQGSCLAHLITPCPSV